MRVDSQRGDVAHAEGIPISHCTRNRLHADDAVRPRAVIHHHLLLPLLRHLLRIVTAQHIDRAAGRVGEDEAHALGGIVLCGCDAGSAE